MTSNTSKPATYQPAIWSVRLFIGSIAAAGIVAWYGADLDLISKVAAMVSAGLTALVIMFTVEALGRSWASALLLPILAICACVQAVTFEQSFRHYVETPHKATFEKGLDPLVKELDRTTKALDAAQVAVDAFVPETVDCSPCRNTRREAAERDALRRAPLDKALAAAKVDRQAALTKLEDARKGYSAPANHLYVLIAGALLDIAAAFAIWALEMTRLKIRKEHEAKREAERAKRAKAKGKVAKARPRAPIGSKPYLIAANDR